MKSEYRCLVEMIISDERKLAEVTSLHTEALERFQKATETLAVVGKRLESRRVELSKLDALLHQARPRSAGGGPAPQAPDHSGLQGQIKEINASLKFLCREVMRPET